MSWQPGTGPQQYPQDGSGGQQPPWNGQNGQPAPWGQQAYPPQYAPAWQPPQVPPRRSWPRRHKFLTALIAVIAAVLTAFAVLVVIVAVSPAGSGNGAAPAAGLADCGEHNPVTSREWLEIAKDPDAARGQCIIVYGEITQFDAATGPSGFLADAGGVSQKPSFGYVDYPVNTLFAGDAKMLSSLVEGDLFTAEVTVAGSQSYDTQAGGSTTAPALRVDSVKRTGHVAS